MEELLKFGTEHPSRVIEFSDLTRGLFAEVENGNVNVGNILVADVLPTPYFGNKSPKTLKVLP